MKKKGPSKLLIEIQSIGNFLQDTWLAAFFLVFFRTQTTFPTPYVWLGILICILIVITLLFKKIGYQIAGSVVVSIFFGLGVFVFSGPFWLFVLIVVFSIWRIQERFSKIQEDSTYDGFFFTLLVILFSLSYFLATISKNEEALSNTYFLTISGVLLYILNRLIVQWMLTRDINQLALSKVIRVYLIIVGAASLVYFLISSFAHWIRMQVIDLFGGLFMVILYPIGMLMDWLRGFYHVNLTIPKEEESVVQGESVIREDVKPTSESVNVVNDLPWTIILIVISTVLLIFFIWRFSKNKREEFDVIDEGVSFIREPIKHTQVISVCEIEWAYSMETNVVRDAYREFEKKASEIGYTRQKEETIREWFKRQNWKVSERFYTVYDVVRYSQSSMNSLDGEWFIQHLNSLSKNYFKKDV